MKSSSVALLVLSVFIASISQILLKKSSMKEYSSLLKEYLNRYVIVAYSLFFSTTLLTVIAYRNLELKYGAVIETLGYVFVLILGKVLLKEKITKHRIIGIGLIILGVMVFVY